MVAILRFNLAALIILVSAKGEANNIHTNKLIDKYIGKIIPTWFDPISKPNPSPALVRLPLDPLMRDNTLQRPPHHHHMNTHANYSHLAINLLTIYEDTDISRFI